MEEVNNLVFFKGINTDRKQFEENFSKKFLSSMMKTIISDTCDDLCNRLNIENPLKTNEKTMMFFEKAANQISECAYDSPSQKGCFINSVIETVNKYSKEEFDYREKYLLGIINDKNNSYEYKLSKINSVLSAEDFMNKDIYKRMKNEINFKFSEEAEDIITEIGKDVGESVSKVEEKNAIIQTTMKTISEEKDKIKKEYGIDDSSSDTTDDGTGNTDDTSSEEPTDDSGAEPTDTENNDETSTDDTENEEPVDNENESESKETGDDDVDNNDTENGTESFNYEQGTEKIFLTSEDRKYAIDDIKKNRNKYISETRKIFDTVNRNMKSAEKDEKYARKIESLIRTNYLDKKGYIDESIDKLNTALDFIIKRKNILGNSRRVVKIPIAVFKIEKESITMLKFILIFLFGLSGAIVSFIISQFDNQYKASERAQEDIEAALKLPYMSKYVKYGFSTSGGYRLLTVGIKFDFNLRKIHEKGFEDTEIENIEENLETEYEKEESNVVNPFENVAEEVKSENETENENDFLNIEDSINKEIEENSISTEAHKKIYSNKIMSKVLVPLSPTKLDNMKMPSLVALSAIYSRATERFDLLRDQINSRFTILEDIVKKESDEELTNKFNNYKALSMEAMNNAELFRDTINHLGCNSFGVVSDDIRHIAIADRLYKLSKGNYKLKYAVPKEADKYKGFEDVLDAVFDLVYLRREYHKTFSTEDLLDIQSREEVLFNILDLGNHTTKEQKDEVEKILNITDLEFGDKCLVDTDFLTSIKLKVKALALKNNPPESKSEFNERVLKRVIEKVKYDTLDEVSPETENLIRSIVNGEDVTDDDLSTPFEKFIINEGRNEINNKNDMVGDFELSAESIKGNAIIKSVIYEFVNKVKPFTEDKINEFNKHIMA